MGDYANEVFKGPNGQDEPFKRKADRNWLEFVDVSQKILLDPQTTGVICIAVREGQGHVDVAGGAFVLSSPLGVALLSAKLSSISVELSHSICKVFGNRPDNPKDEPIL